MKKIGFTLIELIVVITILSILGTIAFVSFKGYVGDAKKSVIIEDISNIYKGLNINKIKSGAYPIPTDYMTVKAGGIDITYEGGIGEEIQNQISTYVNNSENYSYLLSGDKNNISVIGKLNDVTFLTGKAFASNNVENYLYKGENLTALYDSSDNFVSDDILNLVNSDTYIVSNGKKIIPSGTSYTANSCNSLLELGVNNGNGIYNIIQDGAQKEVYCDMVTDGGGWTLFFAAGTKTIGKSYKDLLIEKPGINISNKNINSAYLFGMENFTKFSDAKSIMTKDVYNWKKGEFSSIDFETNSTLNKFIDYTLTTVDDICTLLPNNEFFTIRNSNGYNQKYGKIMNWYGRSYGWADCMKQDGILNNTVIDFGEPNNEYFQTEGSDVQDYIRHYMFDVNARNANIVRGIGGLSRPEAETEILGRYFIR